MGFFFTALVILFCVSTSASRQLVTTAVGGNCDLPCYVGDRPSCEVTWAPHVSAVFLGTVVTLKEESIPVVLNGEQSRTVKLIATVKIDEPFFGVEDSQVTVISGGDMCGFPFSRSRRYLFYAKRLNKSGYSVTLCGGTKWANEAAEDLKYLRSLASLQDTGSVFGTVFQYLQPAREDPRIKIVRAMKPVAGAKVKIIGGLQSYATLTGQDGRFRAEGLPPGAYKVEVETDNLVSVASSAGFSIGPQGPSVTVSARGCAEVSFQIDPFARPR